MRAVCELNLEIAKAQMARMPAAGLTPRVTSVTFVPLDIIGKSFSCRVTFDYGIRLRTTIMLDAAANLNDSDWHQRLDAALFGDQRWPQ
jgi:hypothetical protein